MAIRPLLRRGIRRRGYQFSVGLKTDGTLWSWGYNGYGQLGTGTNDSSAHATPVQVGTDNKWAAVDAGQYHTAAVKTDGTLWAWGYNYYGQLGDASNTQRASPVRSERRRKWVSVSAGNYFTLGVKADGMLWAWGYNYYGQLGDGTAIDKNTPLKTILERQQMGRDRRRHGPYGRDQSGRHALGMGL